MSDPASRSDRLHRAITSLLSQAPEVEAAAVVSFDGLPMASALPVTMDEDRVAAMSAALLSLGERAAEGLGRGALSQVYIEGESGTVFLVSADDEAVLVAVAAKGAKVGMMLYEVRRAAAAVVDALRRDDADAEAAAAAAVEAMAAYVPPAAPALVEPNAAPLTELPSQPLETLSDFAIDGTLSAPPVSEPVAAEPLPAYSPVSSEPAWPAYLPNGSAPASEPPAWS